MKLNNARGLRFPALVSQTRWTAVCGVVLAMAAGLASQTVSSTTQRANRITQELGAGPNVTVAGTVHPMTRRATDVGAVNSAMPMDTLTLNIGLSAAQQAELDALLEAQQERKSAQFHQWLTQEEYGARFGLTDADLSKVTGWLTGQGFTVKGVSAARNAIYFGGMAWQVESAFHTQIHQYQLDGETHFANATDLRVSAGIGSVMLNVRGLDNFRLKPHAQRRSVPSYTVNTKGGVTHFLSPADWATIYDVNSIYAASCAGSLCDGTGMHVGVVGQTYAPIADITNFRTASGLGAAHVNYFCIDSNKAHCGNAFATAPNSAGDLGEADLDIEWAGGIAKNATVDYVYAPYSDACTNTKCTTGVTDPVTNQGYGVFDALQRAVEDYKIPNTSLVLPVISMSYTDCEANFVGQPSYVSWVTKIGQEANAQGQTIVVASGDTGAFGCETSYPASQGVWAGIPIDSPNYTGVGGTVLNGDESAPSTYWNQTLNLVDSALAYIPEMVWNDTSVANGLSASGGGVSVYFPQPTWQNGLISGHTTGRMVPDVAFAASAEHDGYLTCSTGNYTATNGNDCTSGFVSSTNYFDVAGGTSAGTPSFAGVLTLLVQKYGNQGNINPTLYGMANSNPAVFHDIKGGNNFVPCTMATTDPGCVNSSTGYSATTGYDLVTGLGSIDGGALYAALANSSSGGTGIAGTYTLSAGSNVTMSAGKSVSVILNLSSANYTGPVSFNVSSSSPSEVSGSAATVITMPNNSTLLITATASAANHAPRVRWKSGGAVMLCVVLLGAPFARRGKRAVAVLLAAAAISMAGFLIACGGGSSTAAAVPAAKAARTYTLTVTPTGTAPVANPLAVKITVTVT